MSYRIRQLDTADAALFGQLLDVFGTAFEQEEAYGANRPRWAYLERLLSGPSFIAIALYSGLGAGEEVLHFDIEVPPPGPPGPGSETGD